MDQKTEKFLRQFVNACKKGDVDFLNKNMSRLSPLEINAHERNALFQATLHKQKEVIDWLIAHGANPLYEDQIAHIDFEWTEGTSDLGWIDKKYHQLRQYCMRGELEKSKQEYDRLRTLGNVDLNAGNSTFLLLATRDVRPDVVGWLRSMGARPLNKKQEAYLKWIWTPKYREENNTRYYNAYDDLNTNIIHGTRVL